MGAALNPIAAFVEDATSAVILLVGSKCTKKWQFLKVSLSHCLAILSMLQRIFLPFAANELFACLADKELQGAEVFQYEITFSAFEIQDEVLCPPSPPLTSFRLSQTYSSPQAEDTPSPSHLMMELRCKVSLQKQFHPRNCSGNSSLRLVKTAALIRNL